MMATSQLTNILLLVAVGLVIYYMTQSVENLEDVSPEVAAPAAEEMVMPVEEENRLTRNEFDVIYSMLNDLDDWEHRRIRDKLQMMEQLK